MEMGVMLPTGTVTFLFTDIEGSTKLWQEHADVMPSALARHHEILRDTIDSHRGYVFQIIGDAFCAAFATAPDALAAALAAQRGLHVGTRLSGLSDHAPAHEEQPSGGEPSSGQPQGLPLPIRVRMGLHTGEAEWRGSAYDGYLTLTRAQRVMSAGHGGQILLSQATYDLARNHLPHGVMTRDLGEHRLKGLTQLERIFQVVAPDLPDDFPPLRSWNAIPTNLPAQLTSFVGREREIAEVKRLLTPTLPRSTGEGVRLLTLTGVGGTGKTRLSLQVAADVLDAFPDGVWFVELAPLFDPALLPQTVAQTLHVPTESGHPVMDTLTDDLRGQRLLLILDNCEHLIDACAQLADTLLRACPKVQILASSREALGIAGETAWPVPSLQVPTKSQVQSPMSHVSDTGRGTSDIEQYESVRLFVERAVTVQPKFVLMPTNAQAVAQICQRLDGIPLAIELAAARVKALSPEQIAARLDDRFRLLTGGSRTSLPRQQTLRAAIDWSYNLLSEPERVLLRRLSVFAGGWTLEAAESVCGDDVGAIQEAPLHRTDILDLLTHLIDKSLVVVEEREGDSGAVRYRFLETIRQYAREKLLESGEGERVRDRHLDYFMRLAEEVEPKFRSAEQASWLNRLEAELDNVRVGLDWSVGEAKIEMGLRLAGALFFFWFVRGHQTEGIETLQNLLARPEATARSLARAKALNTLSHLYVGSGDYHQAKGVAHEALAIGQALQDVRTTALALYFLGWTNAFQGNDAEAQAWLEQSLALYRVLGDKLGVSLSLLVLGLSALRVGEYARAQAWFAEAAALERELGDQTPLAFNLRHWGFALLHQHDYAGTIPKFRESLTLNVETGSTQGIAACLAACAALALAREQFERAAQLFGAAEVLLESLHTKLWPYDQDQYTRNVATLRAQLDEVTFNEAWAAGRALTMVQAIQLAMSEG